MHRPRLGDAPVGDPVVGQPRQVDRIAGNVANWIRSQGYYAENQGGPSSGKMNLIPAALQAGLGELGKECLPAISNQKDHRKNCQEQQYSDRKRF